MVTIIVLLALGFGWIVLFEAGWRKFSRKGSVVLSKGTACKCWWGLFVLLMGMSGPVGVLLGLMLLLCLGLSHVDRAMIKDDIITVEEILRNIGPALRDGYVRIKPYLK